MNKQKFPYTCLGSVTSGDIVIDDETNYGQIQQWKPIYDNLLAQKMES